MDQGQGFWQASPSADPKTNYSINRPDFEPTLDKYNWLFEYVWRVWREMVRQKGDIQQPSQN